MSRAPPQTVHTFYDVPLRLSSKVRDINRTFPKHVLYRVPWSRCSAWKFYEILLKFCLMWDLDVPAVQDKQGLGQQQLLNVLRAYSIFNAEVGYCKDPRSETLHQKTMELWQLLKSLLLWQSIGRGWNRQSHETSQLTQLTTPPKLFHKFCRGSILPGDIVAKNRRRQNHQTNSPLGVSLFLTHRSFNHTFLYLPSPFTLPAFVPCPLASSLLSVAPHWE